MNKGNDSNKWDGRLGGTGANAAPNKGNKLFDQSAESHRSSVKSKCDGSARDKGKGHHV